MNSDLMIETKGLTKSFGKLVAVNGLNLNVRRGNIHGFVGPNGAGKTTTMKMLIGAIRSTGGEGYINGHPVGSLEARKSLGFSPERPSFYVDMTTWDYLVYMGRLAGMKTDAAQKRARELIDWLELTKFRDSKVGGFSAGMKQRLSLAQAMTHQPQLLILDEPTANLDPDGRMSLTEKLRQLCQEQRITIFVSSHQLLELEQLVDAVTLIEKGRTVAEDSVRDLKQELTLNRYVLKVSKREVVVKALQGQTCVQDMTVDADGAIHLISSDFAALQSKVIEAVTRAGAEMEYFGKEQANLQDVYRQTMGRDQ
ncbi:MAG: ABC transporter ATP-binding protein [Dehalococcoidia bacterium]|nr:ABC transporter ATP-binding protein [Dehalococcoidia bacterium]